MTLTYIPVGVLSQVYEWSAERWAPHGRKKHSLYYTPRRIAEYVVREIFSGLVESDAIPPHRARVLDPAVGGGVFLVAAFQEIVAAWWRFHKRPPTTRELRNILYSQLTGFDVQEPALRLSALSLYLTSIELDTNPHPVEKLRFESLRGRVLFNMRDQAEGDDKFTLGSISEKAGGGHRHAYDVVVSNPPWTALSDAEGQAIHFQMVNAIRPIVAERLGLQRAKDFRVPDQVPDLPFVWRAIEWARIGGWIGIAVHGRLLFKTSTGGRNSREDLFEAVRVTGILNGADLRDTKVWPRVSAPFCLLFAKNELPSEGHSFFLVSPYRERLINRQGRLRIDERSAQPVALTELRSYPYLLKALFRGTALDIPTLKRLTEERFVTLGAYWKQLRLASGQGYQVTEKPKMSSSFLRRLRNCTPETLEVLESGPLIATQELPKFNASKVHRRRKRQIYKGPVVLVRESPPTGIQQFGAYMALGDVAFSESFYGYSTSGSRDPNLLAKYLVLLMNSSIFLWYMLLTSSKFGVERESIYKEDVDSFPLRPLEHLSVDQLEELERTFEFLQREGASGRGRIDDFIRGLYELSQWELQVIRDTLNVSLPFRYAQENAERDPTPNEVERFLAVVSEHLGAGSKTGEEPSVILARGNIKPWLALEISLRKSTQMTGEPVNLSPIVEAADELGASQIILADKKEERFIVAILNEYRYWTETRARLLALELCEHFPLTLIKIA